MLCITILNRVGILIGIPYWLFPIGYSLLPIGPTEHTKPRDTIQGHRILIKYLQ